MYPCAWITIYPFVYSLYYICLVIGVTDFQVSHVYPKCKWQYFIIVYYVRYFMYCIF